MKWEDYHLLLLLQGVKGEVTRHFTESSSITQTYGQFTSTVTLTGDFEIELGWVRENRTGTAATALLGSLSSSDHRLRVNDTGNASPNDVILRLSATNITFSGAMSGVTLGALSTLRLVRTGSTVELFVNGVSKGTRSNLNTFAPNVLGQTNGAEYANGILANLKIINEGTLVVDSPIDDAPDATYFRNKAAVLGSDLVTNGDFEDGTNDWVAVNAVLSVVDGELKVIGTANTDRASQIVGGLSVGVTHLVSGNIKNGTASPEIIVWNATQTVVLGRSSVDGGGVMVTPTEATVVIWLRANAGEAFFSNISIKEIPAATPLIEKFNYVEADTLEYVFDGNVSPNTWTDVDTGLIVIEVAGT